MKARINLYDADLRPTFEWISGSHLMALVGLCILLSGASYGALYMWKSGLQEDADRIAQDLQQQQQLIDDLSMALQAKTNDPALNAQLTNLQVQIAAQDSILLRVKDMGQLKQKSFSALFDALASANSDYVWITNFTIDESDLNIVGQISQPSALTRWIAQLSRTEFFKGQEFSEAKVEREEDIGLVFSLTSSKKSQEILVAAGGNDVAN